MDPPIKNGTDQTNPTKLIKSASPSISPSVSSNTLIIPSTVSRPTTVTGSTSSPIVVLRPVHSSPMGTVAPGIKRSPQAVKIAPTAIRSGVLTTKPSTAPIPVIKVEAVKQENVSDKSNPAKVAQKNVIREMQVRVPNRRDRRFSILHFHSSDRPELSCGTELFLQRENNLKQFRSVHNISDAPERGAGTEFGREAKEEARLRKYGIIRENYRPDDQPWIMTVGKGKSSRRRFRGVREGSVSENMEYFVFCQCKDGNFDAYPVHAWYKMKPEINYRFLREDEAEVEYNRLHKTMNLFNVMIKRKLTDGEGDVEGSDQLPTDKELGKELRYLSVATENRATGEKDTAADRDAASRTRRTDRTLKLTDLEEIESGSDVEEDEETGDQSTGGGVGDSSLADASSKPGSSKQRAAASNVKIGNKSMSRSAAEQARLLRKKQRDAMIVSRMRRRIKKRKARKSAAIGGSSSESDDPMDEVRDESELDDHEGDEVDYMTNSSSDEEKLSIEEREKIYEETGVDEETGLKALLTDISTDEENEEKRLQENRTAPSDAEDFQEDSNQTAPDVSQRSIDPVSHTRSKPSGDGLSPSSSSSSVDDDTSSYTSSLASSSDSDADPEEKMKAKVKKATLLQKLSHSIHGTSSSSTGEVAAPGKRRLVETSDSGASPAVDPTATNKRPKLEDTPLPPPSATDSELMNTVRKYLMRKPITVTDLLKKIRSRKLVGKNEDAQTALANVLRQLRPIKQIINGQHALSLKH